MALIPELNREEILQKDNGFDRCISGSTAAGDDLSDLEPLEDLQDFEDEPEEYEEPQRGLAIRPSRKALQKLPGMQDVWVKPLHDPIPSFAERHCLKQANLPTRTWAVTPESPAALNPPSADDESYEQRSVEFHPLVTCHLFRP
mmetsp:Transcript_131044/g.184744  ORF Transcript_131044/g.184744 Transcript_131044/m.184744 type:complete len:144 (-) Transcript_131044:279-710(-)